MESSIKALLKYISKETFIISYGCHFLFSKLFGFDGQEDAFRLFATFSGGDDLLRRSRAFGFFDIFLRFFEVIHAPFEENHLIHQIHLLMTLFLLLKEKEDLSFQMKDRCCLRLILFRPLSLLTDLEANLCFNELKEIGSLRIDKFVLLDFLRKHVYEKV